MHCFLLLGAALGDGWRALVLDAAAAGATELDRLDNAHGGGVTRHDLAEDNVTAVQPGGHDGGDEELRAVGVRASVGHRQKERLVVGQLEVLVGELLAVDGLAAGAVATGEVTALKHELRDDTVELAALVAEALLAGAERTEVLGGLGDDVVEELKVDAARALLDLLVGASDLTRGIDGSLGALPGAVKENLHDHVGG